MPKRSAGILLFRRSPDLEVLIAHPGGPYFAKKDTGAWTIPKGLVEDGEGDLETAIREFREETGQDTDGPYIDLDEVRLKSGKRIHAFASEGAFDEAALKSNPFEIEWPRGSGKTRSFPEIDRVMWANPEVAKGKLNPAQAALVDRLAEKIGQKLATEGDT